MASFTIDQWNPLTGIGFNNIVILCGINDIKGNGLAEDDGVILASVYDGIKSATYLAIIDAKSMKTISTIYCQDDWKHLMSFGIHGDFFQCKEEEK